MWKENKNIQFVSSEPCATENVKSKGKYLTLIFKEMAYERLEKE